MLLVTCSLCPAPAASDMLLKPAQLLPLFFALYSDTKQDEDGDRF